LACHLIVLVILFICSQSVNIFAALYSCLLLAVRTGVVRGAALLGTRLLIVVVVLFSAHHQLVALPQKRRRSAHYLAVSISARKEVCGLSDGRDQLLGRLDRVVRTIVLHRHLEVCVHHPVAPTHVYCAAWVQRC